LCLLWVAGIFYAARCMQGYLIRPAGGQLVFNEMLSNLLHGRFDLDPAAMGDDAFIYQGRSYAYFGIFCAFLRLPLLLTGRLDIDMTGLSIWIAAAISLASRLAMVASIFNKGRPANPLLRLAVLAAVVTNGESIQFLLPNIYQEVVSWGDALASVFVLIAARLVLGLGKGTAANYAVMALIAGLALLCRVTFGLSLYCALALMGIVEVLRARRADRQIPVCLRRLAPAAATLAIFAMLTGSVNYARWGNPLTFMPLQYQTLMAKGRPDRPLRLERYGAVNLRRVPFSLQYYFAPIWALNAPSGKLLLQSQQQELYDGVEFPPGSIFLSDTLFCILAAIGLWTLAVGADSLVDPPLAKAALIGLTAGPCVMLAATYLAFRYRLEFYPALNFAAYIGLKKLVGRERALPKPMLPIFGFASVSAMIVAFLTLLSYALLGARPATDFNVARGWIGLLEDRAAGKNVLSAEFTSPDRKP
jgi:hypothetical protein